jgi:thiamine kinase-like enzyme
VSEAEPLIPESAQAITTEWLSQVLGVSVKSVRVAETHDGTTGRAVLELEYVEAGKMPHRLFVKLPPTDPMQRNFVQSSGMGRREVMFYQQLSAEVPLRVPHCYYAASNDAGDEYIMLLEHLEDSACTFQNASTRYSADYIRQVLTSFAALHANYWTTPRFATDLSWLEFPLQHDIALPLMERAMEQYGPTMPSIFRTMGELYLNQTDAIHRLWTRGEATLIHGDVHDNNLFYDADRPGFLDWALVARGPAMRDVGYFLAGTIEPGDQAAWGPEMLAYYRQQLLALGAPAPTAEELWRQYQWHAAYVWVGATITLAMGDAWQPTSFVLTSLKRLHGALESIGSHDAIVAAIES